MIGERLRDARRSQNLSLQSVSERADISVATLSRIENNKQGIQLSLFLTLARILEQLPHDLLEEHVGEGVDPIIRKLSTFDSRERTQLWNDLATASRTRKTGRRGERQLDGEVEELLAQLDYLRAEIESVHKRFRPRT